MTIKKAGFIILMVMMLWSQVFPGSENRKIKIRHIQGKPNLSHDTIYCILQDSKGFMWFGTGDGLNLYDGYGFEVYKTYKKDPDELGADEVNTIYEDGSGVVWIGSCKTGLYKFDRGTMSFTRQYRHNPEDPGSLSCDRIFSIYEDHKGEFWIGTTEGLDKFDRETGIFTHYKVIPRDPDIEDNKTVFGICEDEQGELWIGLWGSGLHKLNRETGTFTRYDANPGNPHGSALYFTRVLYRDREGTFWLGAADSTLCKFDRESGTFNCYKAIPDSVNLQRHTHVRSMCEDRRGDIWIGTSGSGLYKFHRESRTFTCYNTNGLKDYHIKSLYNDSSGLIWIGTEIGGIYTLHEYEERFIHYKNEPGNPDSLSQNIVFSIFEDRSGVLWIGTKGGGLNKFDGETGRFTCYKSNPDDPGSLSHDIVSSIWEDRRGELWVATWGGGLNTFDRERETFRRFKPNPDDLDGVDCDFIHFIYEDRAGNLWFGINEGGLAKFDRQKGRFKRYRHNPDDSNSLSFDILAAIFEDQHGNLWIGTCGGGLNKFDPVEERFTCYREEPANLSSLSHNVVVSICHTHGDVFWIGTYGGGLNRFDSKQETFTRYGVKEGLLSDIVCGIMEDRTGNLWIAARKGLSKFNPRTGMFKNYTIEDGLKDCNFIPGACYKNRRGEMFFGGINGLTTFSPEKVRENPHVPPVVITDLWVSGKRIGAGENSPLQKHISETKEIVLSHKHRFLSVGFAALDYRMPEKNQYAYRLEGSGSDWIYLGTQHHITFPALDAGKYIFRVKGSNNDNIWNDEGASILITIRPPYWRTWWFVTLFFIFFAAVSYFIINLARKYSTFFAFWRKKNYIGRYKVMDIIGTGGMGVIYKVHDILDKSRIFAVKLMREEYFTDKTLVKRFKNEASIIDQLNHPNIVRVIERGEYEGQLYMVMELLKGKNLQQIIKEERKAAISMATNIMVQIMGALCFIHKKHIVHRDLKPENIMITQSEENLHFVKLLDFGLAKSQSLSRLTQTGVILGTIFYLSPEQLLGAEITAASDIYSVGIIFYEFLAGQKPFSGPNEENIIKQILFNDPIDLSRVREDIPGELNRLVMQMINKEPKNRPSAKTVLNVLAGFNR